LHRAFGLDPTDYDLQVLEITSEISRQVFPFTLDLKHPRFIAGLARLARLTAAADAARKSGRFWSPIVRAGLGVAVAVEFVRLYLLPTRPNELPREVRLSPAW